MVDILPTLIGLGAGQGAGQGAEEQYHALATDGESNILGLDGVDQWEAINRHAIRPQSHLCFDNFYNTALVTKFNGRT